MADRRRDLRAVVRLEVRPGSETLKRPPFYVACNISRSGMFLITTDPLPEKTQFKIKFQLPNDGKPISLIAEVLWCRERDERPPFFPGMGIKFTEISANDQTRIDEYIKAALKENKNAEDISI